MPDVRGLILYDSVCILCSRWTQFVIARDPAGLFTFMPVQGDTGRALALSLGINPDEPDTFAVVIDGQAYLKSAGAIAIVERLPGWSWFRFFRSIPRPLRDWFYDRIARNRYRIFGKADSCIIPDEKIRSRFEDIESALNPRPLGSQVPSPAGQV